MHLFLRCHLPGSSPAQSLLSNCPSFSLLLLIIRQIMFCDTARSSRDSPTRSAPRLALPRDSLSSLAASWPMSPSVQPLTPQYTFENELDSNLHRGWPQDPHARSTSQYRLHRNLDSATSCLVSTMIFYQLFVTVNLHSRPSPQPL
jgi:hypothetical protein